MALDWIQEQVKAFGRLLGLQSFELNERGMAALQFENGVKFRLEGAADALWLQVLLEVPSTPEMMEKVMAEASPARNVPTKGGETLCVRAGYLDRSGEALLAMKLAGDEIEASRIDAAFHELFERARRLGRMA